jgi:biopolymer transport protein ExbD
MRYASRRGAGFAEGDMTPMIDMTFQLIAFFMVLVNFSEAEQSEAVKLPSSELAKPPEMPVEKPLTVQLGFIRTDTGEIIRPVAVFGTQEFGLAGGMEVLRQPLSEERQLLQLRGDDSARNATIIIRADREWKTGEVQELIKICQDIGFEKFVLRAKHQQSRTRGTDESP